MDRVRRYRLLLLPILFILKGSPVTADPPNVIIMLMDDMGWGDLGWNGEPSRETPNIDRLAAEGLTVPHMYTAAPLCSPSRASLLTGRLPIRNGFYSDNTHGMNAYTPQEIVGGIPDEEVLLPEALAARNYTSGLIGKWHLGHRDQYLPLKHGFHSWFGAPNCHFGPYSGITTPNIPVFRDDHMLGRYYKDFAIDKNKGVSNMTELFIQEAVEFIERESSKGPFFLFWTPDSIHAPTYSSPHVRGTSRRGRYGDAVKETDAGVGAIVEALRTQGVDNNTLIFFSSDNGAALVSKEDGGSNGPFLCGKQTTFEGGMRAPGIFWWPGVIPAGSVSYQVMTHMDLFSTVAQIAGAEIPSDRIIDGLPLYNSLVHPELEILRPVFLYRGDRLMAVRKGSYKMHLWTFSTPTDELARGINFCPGEEIPNLTTPIPTNHTGQPILFNIEVDPGEKYPLSRFTQEYSKQVTELQQVVSDHEAQLVPGEPMLNWCDNAVMHWSPPGCEALGECISPPESNPYLCFWDH
ncbi:hypothetical protein Pcinc_038922 [Petrolisthes cinctipes]|uniref:Sulfatase N-terminal domain-containing protein n=1 Tax=Petrolisthes cinctipes TaxID=88211 RepID=A0AAE1BQU6_PETCI|nr:hypothetical protein Pcinc_038922 [Petrolisthes cinctipes]